MSRPVGSIQAELLIDPTEIGQTEGADLVVHRPVSSEHWQFAGWFGSFGARPDDIGRLDIGMG